MSDILIRETETDDRYEAKTIVRGVIISQVFYRDAVTGLWPDDYKQKAHDRVRLAALKELAK